MAIFVLELVTITISCFVSKRASHDLDATLPIGLFKDVRDDESVAGLVNGGVMQPDS